MFVAAVIQYQYKKITTLLKLARVYLVTTSQLLQSAFLYSSLVLSCWLVKHRSYIVVSVLTMVKGTFSIFPTTCKNTIHPYLITISLHCTMMSWSDRMKYECQLTQDPNRGLVQQQPGASSYIRLASILPEDSSVTYCILCGCRFKGIYMKSCLK